jgi:penicillin G amidase
MMSFVLSPFVLSKGVIALESLALVVLCLTIMGSSAVWSFWGATLSVLITRSAPLATLFVGGITLEVMMLVGCIAIAGVIVSKAIWIIRGAEPLDHPSLDTDPAASPRRTFEKPTRLSYFASGIHDIFSHKRWVHWVNGITLSWMFLIQLVVLLGIGLVSFLILSTYTSYSGVFIVEGIKGPIKIQRDVHGVVYIEANSTEDLFFGQGYAFGQDRLWQMEFLRRAASGRLSEVFGAATLDQDLFFRTLGFSEAGKDLDYTSVEMESLAAGINAFANSSVARPLEFRLFGVHFEPFTVQDVMKASALLSWSLCEDEGSERTRYKLLLQGMSLDRILQLYGPPPAGMRTILSHADLESMQIPQRPLDNRPETEASQAELQAFWQQLQKEFATTTNEEVDATSIPSASTSTPTSTSSAAPSSWIERVGVKVAAMLTTRLIQRPKGASMASNNWVIGAERSGTGSPILANDPHLDLKVPSVWQLQVLHCESCNIHAKGGAMPGIPGILTGHNHKIAWGVTNTMLDVMDYYVMQPVDNGYLHDNTIKSYEKREENITIFDPLTLGGYRNHSHSVLSSVYGPVVNSVPLKMLPVAGEQLLSLRWTFYDKNDSTVFAFLNVMKAENWEEFREALRSFRLPAQNFIYADHANIGYQVPGHIPIRVPGHTGQFPVPGTGQYDWQGYIPFDDLPMTYNPPEGFIATSNNQIVPHSYPYRLNAAYDISYRAERVAQMVKETKWHNIATVQSMQMDQKTLLFADLLPLIQGFRCHSQSCRQWQEKLVAWNGVADKDSQESTLFHVWYQLLVRIPDSETGNHESGQPAWLYQTFVLGHADPACSQQGRTCEQTALDLFETAVAECLAMQAGNNNNNNNNTTESAEENVNESEIPSWGDVLHYEMTHFIMSDLPILGSLYTQAGRRGGSRFTVNVAFYIHEFVAYLGPSYRHVIDLSNLATARYILSTGQSENIFSPHFLDFLDDWADGGYILMNETAPMTALLQLNPVEDPLGMGNDDSDSTSSSSFSPND